MSSGIMNSYRLDYKNKGSRNKGVSWHIPLVEKDLCAYFSESNTTGNQDTPRDQDNARTTGNQDTPRDQHPKGSGQLKHYRESGHPKGSGQHKYYRESGQHPKGSGQHNIPNESKKHGLRGPVFFLEPPFNQDLLGMSFLECP